MADASPAAPRPAADAGSHARRRGWRRSDLPSRLVYWGLHAACALVLVTGASAGDLALFAATYSLRMFGITAGYHRYFAHRTYRTSRPFQLLLALLGCSATQKGPLWWAGHHRDHHRYADQPGRDVHSPADGLYYAHQGWVFDGRWDETPLARIRDFARYPELGLLDRWYVLPPAAVAVACLAIGGFSGLLWGFAVSTVALWHTTYAVNSLCHVWGRRRYDTPDTSRNNWLLGLLAMGEGWHNNHHHYCASTRQGFRWWEIDVTYYALRALQALGLVWGIREPPQHVLHPEPRPELDRAA